MTSWLTSVFALNGLLPGSSDENVGAVVLPPAGSVLTFMRIMQPACDVVLCALHELASSPIDR